MRVVIAEAGM